MRKKELKLVVTSIQLQMRWLWKRHVKRIIHRAESSRFQELSQQDVDFPGAQHLTEREEIVAMMEKVGIRTRRPA